ncbi:MAG: DUF3048 domain-containing protein [Lachnospiraceae bacterium]|nr:DUF3048 domain-containing protein [Lachnospiraceae bacterium]
MTPSSEPDSYDSNIHIVTEDDSLPPQENMVRSRLTNEWIDAEAAETRPIAVIIPNESAALPHYNLSKASILYEANVEGRMSRLMAVYEDWESLVRIGNIRSARTYYAYWAFEWDAFLVHYGGPYYINELMAEPTTENINGLAGSEEAFYRSKDRSEPHNVYADGKTLLQSIKKHNYQLEYRGMTDEEHFCFATKAAPNSLTQYGDRAYNATYIDLSGCYPLTRCYFDFNEDDGLYYRFQHLSGSVDQPHQDADGTQLTFKNILVQYITQEVLDQKGYLAMQCHDNTKDGWFFTNGKAIHVTWEKDSDYGATKFYDDDGNEIVLNTGKTMICIVKETDSLTFR